MFGSIYLSIIVCPFVWARGAYTVQHVHQHNGTELQQKV